MKPSFSELSSNLHWNKHIEVVVSKISKNIGIIAKLRHILPQKLICGLYQTLVNPYISYCNLVWALPHETTNLNKFLRIQKKYCRIITFSKFNEHSRLLFVKLSILSVYDTNGRFQDGELTLFPGLTNLLYK